MKNWYCIGSTIINLDMVRSIKLHDNALFAIEFCYKNGNSDMVTLYNGSTAKYSADRKMENELITEKIRLDFQKLYIELMNRA